MALEVEMKAHCRDPEGVRGLLQGRARFVGAFVREDRYFHGPAGVTPERDYRLRRDNGRWVCTFKIKEIRQGLEVNEESEFEVSDGEVFMAFLERLGCRAYITKRKEGTAWRYRDLTVELTEVARLGWFLEVERLLDREDEGLIQETEAAIRGTFRDLGLAEADIEPLPYVALLKRLG